jgi:hypothetical protein
MSAADRPYIIPHMGIDFLDCCFRIEKEFKLEWRFYCGPLYWGPFIAVMLPGEGRSNRGTI